MQIRLRLQLLGNRCRRHDCRIAPIDYKMKRSFIGKGDDQGHGGWYRHPNEDDGEGEKLGRQTFYSWMGRRRKNVKRDGPCGGHVESAVEGVDKRSITINRLV